MSTSLYLDMLDAMLREGVRGLSQTFVDAQVRSVTDCQQPDGGFRGRQGGSDSYYTDFALRTLGLLGPECSAMAGARRWLDRRWLDHCAGTPPESCSGRPRPQPLSHLRERGVGHEQLRSVVECFSELNARRIVGVAADAALCHVVQTVLDAHALPGGGFAQLIDDRRVSVYNTFLAALCCQMLGVPMANVDAAMKAVASLVRPDGGFVQCAGQAVSQTNATAAAAAVLTLGNAMSQDLADGVVGFLASMQQADGGSAAHATAGSSDLLSTFTGVVALVGLDRFDAVDASGVARFVRSAAMPGGGFGAYPGDDAADVEYTYYGLGLVALLRQAAS